MSEHPLANQALALTAIMQAAALVNTIAKSNSADDAACNTLIYSLFQFSPANTRAVYGDLCDFRLGKQAALMMLGHIEDDGNKQTMLSYCAGMIRLAKQLNQDQDLSSAVAQRLQHAQRLIDNFSDSPSSRYATIAGIYTDTISTLPSRISVSGNEQYLKNRANADKIRSLLFAGIRSAILWRQCGGKRRHFLFNRRALINAIQQL